MKNKETKSWEDRFDEKFYYEHNIGTGLNVPSHEVNGSIEEVRDFIREELKAEYKRGYDDANERKYGTVMSQQMGKDMDGLSKLFNNESLD